MQNETKTVGGGSAVGLSEDFIGFLRNALFANQPGQASDPSFGTSQFGELLNKIFGSGVSGEASRRILSGVGEVGLDKDSDIGQNLSKIFEERRTEGVANLRERFGGTDPFGSSAAFAEGRFLADEAPREGLALAEIDRAFREQDLGALGNLFNTSSSQQTSVLMQLLGLTGQLSGLGIPQAQTVSTGSPLGNFFSGLTGAAEAAGGIAGAFRNPFGGKK